MVVELGIGAIWGCEVRCPSQLFALAHGEVQLQFQWDIGVPILTWATALCAPDVDAR